MSKLSEFMFGTEESRAKAKETLKEMRPKYDRPKVGGGSAPKVTRGEKLANPTIGGGRQINSVSRSEMDRMSERMRMKRESEAKSKKAGLPPRPMTGVGPSAVDAVKNPFSRETSKFSGTGSYGSIGGKAPVPAAPKPKAKPAMPAAAAPKPKAKPAMPAAKPKAKPSAPAASSGSGFKGNWKGAAPTAMQRGVRSKNRNLRDK